MQCIEDESDDDGDPKVSLALFELGGGIKICNSPDKLPCDSGQPDSNEDGFDISFGLGRHLGLTLGSDGKVCIAIGPSIGLPITLGVNSGRLRMY